MTHFMSLMAKKVIENGLLEANLYIFLRAGTSYIIYKCYKKEANC